jgi:dihydroorotase
MKALQYVKAIDGVIIQLPDDKGIQPNGMMHEGIVSTRLGLPGRPAIAEELILARDIELVKYTGSKLHFTGISTAVSFDLIRKAKKEGFPVSCSVTPYHLVFSDEDLSGYDSNLKVNPPLRTKEDVAAARKAVMDGTVDCIASHHLPQDPDHKVVEFEYAGNGMTGLQTAYSVVRTALPELKTDRITELFSLNARKIFNLPQHELKEGHPADLTLFQNDASWTFHKNRNESRSQNTPFFGKELKGRVVGIINRSQLFLNQQ